MAKSLSRLRLTELPTMAANMYSKRERIAMSLLIKGPKRTEDLCTSIFGKPGKDRVRWPTNAMNTSAGVFRSLQRKAIRFGEHWRIIREGAGRKGSTWEVRRHGK